MVKWSTIDVAGFDVSKVLTSAASAGERMSTAAAARATLASIARKIFARVSPTGYTNCAHPRDAAENEDSSHGEKGRRHE